MDKSRKAPSDLLGLMLSSLSARAEPTLALQPSPLPSLSPQPISLPGPTCHPLHLTFPLTFFPSTESRERSSPVEPLASLLSPPLYLPLQSPSPKP